MKIFLDSRYRSSSEPFLLIIKQFSLDIEIVERDHYSISLLDEKKEFLKLDEIVNNIQLVGLLKNQFKKTFQTIQLNEELKIITNSIHSILYQIQFIGFNDRPVGIMEQLIYIDKDLNVLSNWLKNNQFRYLFQNQLSIWDLVLSELLVALGFIDRLHLDKKAPDLLKYLGFIESHKIFQLYKYDSEFLLKEYAPNIRNPNKYILNVIKNKINSFHDLAITKGILYKYKDKEGNQFTDNCPVSLLPSQIRLDQFLDLKQKTLIQQKLILKMAREFEWYSQILNKLAQHDLFIRKMLEIQAKVEQSQNSCKYNLCIVRNDFLHNSITDRWMQVEYNCIAISFGFTSDRVQQYHEFLLNQYYKELNYQSYDDKNAQCMVAALSNAFQLYNNKNAIVLIVVGEFEGNIYDQRYMEFGLQSKGIDSIRTTFRNLVGNVELTNDGTLRAFGYEISIVYFRTGYTYDQYENDDQWKVRELFELSKAFKCPSMNTQLVNFKKFQQILLQPNHIQKFVTEEESNLLQQNYCKIWGFDEPDDYQRNHDMVKLNPNDYVLKPQREGGGNNFYDEQILLELEQIPKEKLNEFILMERIKPLPRLGFMLRRGHLDVQAVISEISVIGYFISTKDEILYNEIGGYLVRTKKYLDNEGGVAAGYAVVDSFMIEK